MLDQILPYLPWAGLALVFGMVLLLPFAPIRKLMLELCTWGLRLALLALIGGAIYLWFYPEQYAERIGETLNAVPELKALLPEPGTQMFGICAAAAIGCLFLPLLAIFEVSNRVSGWRGLRTQITQSITQPVIQQRVAAQPVPVVRRINRRMAAEAMAEIGAPKPVHAVAHRR